MGITITEALAEIKTIDKRLEKKREFVAQYLAQPERIKDPFEKDGGSAKVLSEQIQSVTDLEGRKVQLRTAINAINARESITIEGTTRTIAEWIIWRREIAPGQEAFMTRLFQMLAQLRKEAQQRGARMVGQGAAVAVGDSQPTDIIVNIDEKKLGEDRERFQNVLGQLDGLLSLKNATLTLDI